MFTGIITHLGRFHGYQNGHQEIGIEVFENPLDINLGDSLAVNGVCLSLIRKEKGQLFFNLSQETLQKTTLDSLKRGDPLNLELPLTLAAPVGGHLVTGHIDGIGKVRRITPRRSGARLVVAFPPGLRPFFVPKGSVALDGVSLTLASLAPSSLEVEVIPITLSNTNIRIWKPGRSVNIECDIIGKYVYNWAVKS
jgi:riboflavin synthase